MDIAEIKITFDESLNRYRVNEELGNTEHEFHTMNEVIWFLQREANCWKDEITEEAGIELP